MKILMKSCLLVTLALWGCGGEERPGADVAPEEPFCPASADEACGGEGTECSFSTGECICGSPHEHYVCRGGRLELEGRGFDCEYSVSTCNPAACPPALTETCEEEELNCWWVECGEFDSQAVEYHCIDGRFMATGPTHYGQDVFLECLHLTDLP